MKIKTILFLPIFMIFTQNAEGINWYFEGDTLYNWANGGLNIRTEKSLTAQKIGIVPYGEALIVKESKGNSHLPKNVKINFINNEINLTGRWVQIDYLGTIGFVFDGFLSKFEAPILVIDEMNPENFTKESLNDYFERVFGVLGKTTKRPDHETIVEITQFNKGLSKTSIGSKSGYTRYFLPEFSMEEILIFLKNNYWDREVKLTKSKKEDSLIGEIILYEFEDLGPEGYLRITYFQGIITLEIENWC